MISNRRLLVQSSLLYFPKLVSWVTGYAAFSLLFRMRGASEYGDYIVLTAYWGIPAMLAGDLIGSAGQRLLALHVRSDQAERNRVFQGLWNLHLAVVVVIGVLAVLLQPSINEYVFHSPALAEHRIMGLIIYVATASLGFFRYALRGMQLYKQTLTMDLTESCVRNFSWIAISLGFGGGMTIMAGGMLGVASSMVVNQFVLIKRGFHPAKLLPNLEARREIAMQIKSFALIFLCNYGLGMIPTVVLNRFQGPEAVGLYAALFKIVDFTTGPITAAAYFLAPILTDAKIKSETEVVSLLTRSFKITILFLPLVGCVATCRAEIVNLFGLSRYSEAPQVLLAFCVYVVFANISALFGSFADFLGYARARAVLMTIFTVIFASVAVRLAGLGGVTPLAWGTTITYSVMVCSYIALIVHHHSSHFLRQNLSLLAKVVCCSAAAMVLVHFCLPLTVETGFQENVRSFILRALFFSVISAAMIASLALRRVDGRLIIR